MSTFYVWLALIVYVAMGVTIACLGRRHLGAGMSEFFLANRTVGGVVSALTYSATTYSAFMMVGLAGFTYRGGVGALGFEFTYLCGLFLAVYFAPRFWLVGRKYNYISPAELLADRYQHKGVGVVAALLAMVFLVPYSAAQLMGIGFLVSGVSQGAIPVMAGIIIATILAVAWANIAGLRSVAWTDAMQALIMIVTSIMVLLFVVYRGFGGFGSLFHRMESDIPGLLTVPSEAGMFNFSMYLGLCVLWVFFCLSNPQVSQRLFVPKSVKALKQMIGGFLCFGFLYTLVTVLWGFTARLLVPGLTKADMASPSLLALAIVPRFLAIVVMVGIMAAAISTIDSILLTLSSMFTRDIYKNLRPQVAEAKELSLGKWVIPIVSLITLLFAIWASRETGLQVMIVSLSVASSAGLLMAVPSIVGAFFWKGATAPGALSSMIGGAILTMVLQLGGYKPWGHWAGVWGILVCSFLFITVSLLTSPPRQRAEEFMGYLEEELPRHRFI
jgi:SSS family solute:Na+ symporter